MPEFTISLKNGDQPFKHFWEHSVGSGHAPLALRSDWQRQLRRCGSELGFGRVRFHGILSSPMDTLICHADELRYSFFNVDQAYDAIRAAGLRPFVEFSFMPDALASGTQRVFHYAANVTPPGDPARWGVLIEQLASHWVRRYGLEEVRQWQFEVWNEPNMEGFWSGTQGDYFELYRHTALALKRVDDKLSVGGPSTAKNAWISDFLEFCEENQLPADFVSTHHYPTDAFGQPGDPTEEQLAKSRPGALREQARAAKLEARGKPLYYTEWNSSSNPRDPLHDQPYSAAFAVKTIMEAQGLVEGYSFWTFSDIFEENYMPSLPFHGGFGLLNLQGIAKPVYRAFELLHRLGDRALPVTGEHQTVKTWAVRGPTRTTALLVNHALPRHPLKEEDVVLRWRGLPNSAGAALIERIDERHVNPRRVWLALGAPEYLTRDQWQMLVGSSALSTEVLECAREGEEVVLRLSLPPQCVVAVSFSYEE